MDLQSYCNAHFNEMDPPIFLADIKTDRILYLNYSMKNLLHEYSHIIGRKFYEVMGSKLKDVIYREEKDWDFEEFSHDEIYSRDLNMRFSVRHLPFDFKGVTYNLCKYFALEDVLNLKISVEEAMSRCAMILQYGEEKSISSFLELLGTFYDADKTYYYKIDLDNQSVICEENWKCNDDIVVTKDLSSKIEITKLLEWSELRNEAGIIEADNSLKSYNRQGTSAEVMDIFGLNNLVLSLMEDDAGQFIGCIAVANRKELRVDFSVLQTISKFIDRKEEHTYLQNALHEMHHIDILTGFYRRSSYLMKIEHLQIDPQENIGVIFVNVNGTKIINSEFGYAKGDSRIKQSAELLKEYFEMEFYRISGDEFVGFYENVEESKFERFIWARCKEMREKKIELFSVGHAWGEGSRDILRLVQEANTMMYINKQEFYHTSNRQMEEVKDGTLSELLSGLANNEFMIYLQPQIYLKDNTLYGAEALIRRYDKKNNKLVFPNQFISMYEKKSVIRHVDIFVLNQVCELLVAWMKIGKEIPISVNLSRVTLLEYGIVDTIADICDRYKIPHELLVIEVTERVGLIENNVASALIDDFKKKGFKISLDDFGCAYSNIVTLSQIPLDEVKIDKSLVDHIVMKPKNAIIVKHVVSMCNEIDGICTLAEGVEYKKQAEALREYECHLGQGYLYSKPIPVDEFYVKYIK